MLRRAVFPLPSPPCSEPLWRLLFLAMEIASIGIMYYAALVPHLGFPDCLYALPKHFTLPLKILRFSSDVTLNLGGSARVILLSPSCARLSASCFCKTMHVIKAPFMPDFSEPVLFAHLQAVSLLSCFRFFLRTDDYFGPGMNIIERALHGETAAFAFLF